MKIVFDTNVLIAASITPGLCRELLNACIGHHELVTSRMLLEEVDDRLAVKLGVEAPAVREFIEKLTAWSTVVRPEAVPASACRDPDDCVVLGTAVAGGADLIVSGDQDLTSLGSFRGIPIMTPRACFERLRTDGGAGRVAEKRLSWRRAKTRVPRARRRKAGKG